MPLAAVELTREETLLLLALVRARLAEVERAIQGMEEAEGMDLQRHQAIKMLRPQADGLQDLAMKLEGAASDLRAG